jgi:hypothetical protein
MCIVSEEQESFCQWASDYVPKKIGLLECFELWGVLSGQPVFMPLFHSSSPLFLTMDPSASPKNNPIQNLLKVIGTEEVMSEDLKHEFLGRRWQQHSDKVRWLQLFIDESQYRSILSEFYRKFDLKENEKDERSN